MNRAKRIALSIGLLLFLGMSSLLWCQDNIPVIKPGDPMVDGTHHLPHLVRVNQYGLVDGKPNLRSTFTIDLVSETLKGQPVWKYKFEGTQFHSTAIFDQKTAAFIGQEATFAAGYSNSMMEGTTLTSKWKTPKDSVEQSSVEKFDMNAVPANLADVLVESMPLKVGSSYKIPTFTPRTKGIQMMVLNVVRKEEVTVGGKKLEALVIEHSGPSKGTMWILKEPPYLTKWEFDAPDGKKTWIEQELLEVHK